VPSASWKVDSPLAGARQSTSPVPRARGEGMPLDEHDAPARTTSRVEGAASQRDSDQRAVPGTESRRTRPWMQRIPIQQPGRRSTGYTTSVVQQPNPLPCHSKWAPSSTILTIPSTPSYEIRWAREPRVEPRRGRRQGRRRLPLHLLTPAPRTIPTTSFEAPPPTPPWLAAGGNFSSRRSGHPGSTAHS
jgi:hypothetical protein